MLVDVFAAEEPRVFCFDEVEHGLHPQFLLALASFFAAAIRRGHQIVATCQSPTLVLAVCAEVARGLDPNDVCLVSMRRGLTGGAVAQRLAISQTGAIEGGWLRDYADVERELLRSYLADESEATVTQRLKQCGGGPGDSISQREARNPRWMGDHRAPCSPGCNGLCRVPHGRPGLPAVTLPRPQRPTTLPPHAR